MATDSNSKSTPSPTKPRRLQYAGKHARFKTNVSERLPDYPPEAKRPACLFGVARTSGEEDVARAHGGPVAARVAGRARSFLHLPPAPAALAVKQYTGPRECTQVVRVQGSAFRVLNISGVRETLIYADNQVVKR